MGLNLLKNGSFNQPGTRGTLLVADPLPATDFVSSPSAAPYWDAINSYPGPTTTVLLPSTRKHQPGETSGTMLQVCTGGMNSGIRQSFGELDTGPAKTMSAVWVYVLFGKVGVGTGNGEAIGDHDARVSTKVGEWEVLKVPNGVSPANTFMVYATTLGGACFFIDDASVYAGAA